MQKLLLISPSERISAEEALSHKWFEPPEYCPKRHYHKLLLFGKNNPEVFNSPKGKAPFLESNFFKNRSSPSKNLDNDYFLFNNKGIDSDETINTEEERKIEYKNSQKNCEIILEKKEENIDEVKKHDLQNDEKELAVKEFQSLKTNETLENTNLKKKQGINSINSKENRGLKTIYSK